MANVLEKIVADKQLELIERKANFPAESFIADLKPSSRSFYDALTQPNAGYIFECKKASPSKGLIREDFNLDEIIQAYSPYAACISVLTDEKYFQGKFEYLEYVRERVSQPVLNKDFFVDPYQIHLARYHNADAVLLMLSVLDDATYQELANLADSYQLDVLTEVSNEQEVHRALDLKAKIIGINNRNLRDLSTDLATTEKLAPLITHSGHDCVIISESGIYNNADVRRLSPLVNGFLVGSSVMAESNLKHAVKKLVFGINKVCGVTQIDDASFISNSGATHMGLIFAPQSKRKVTIEQAQSITQSVPFNYVGVFVNEDVQCVAEYADLLSLVAVQLHGDEDQQYIDKLRSLLPEQCEVWNACGITQSLPTLNQKNVDRYLLDCKVGSQSGGTGQRFDWRLLAAIEDKSKVILAGGITPQNIDEALKTAVYGLDLNSGVETSPGIKDPQKINQAFAKIRTY